MTLIQAVVWYHKPKVASTQAGNDSQMSADKSIDDRGSHWAVTAMVTIAIDEDMIVRPLRRKKKFCTKFFQVLSS